MRLNGYFGLILLILSFTLFQPVSAQEQKISTQSGTYLVQAGDILSINVWKEEGLQLEVLVRPDGGLSFPLAGHINAQGKSLNDIEQVISERLSKYITDPVVTVTASQLLGNKIFVIGKVGSPGEFIINRDIDVMQALSMAGGMTPFSDVNDIKILRRDQYGHQQAIEFRYGDVEDGDDLEQNIILKSGDVVIVP